MQMVILRTAEARRALGIAHGTFYQRLRAGLIPPPIALGQRARGYPSDEVESVARAMVAGHDDSRIAALVKEMTTDRAKKAERSRS